MSPNTTALEADRRRESVGVPGFTAWGNHWVFALGTKHQFDRLRH